MLNELPTIEQMKNSLYNIYKDWLCPVCDNYQETFAHIWECDIIILFFKILLETQDYI